MPPRAPAHPLNGAHAPRGPWPKLVTLVAALIAVLMVGIGDASAAMVCPPAKSLSGVDVSSYNGVIDWSQVANAGYSFGYARIGDGLFPDPNFQANFAGMKAAGLKPGGYLFFEPAEDPHAQASAMLAALSTAHFAPGDLIPALDVETTGGLSPMALAASIQTAVNDIKTALGVTPVIYTAKGFWDSNVSLTDNFGAPLWIANWGVPCPNTPDAWSTWALWQYTDAGTVPGIPNTTNLDRSFGPNLPIFMRPPALTITKSHTGNFTQGQQGSYTLTVANSTGPTVGPTDGSPVTIQDTLPTGLTPTSIAGTGWNCTLSSLTCTRSDILNPGQSYPPVTLAVNVASNAPAQVTNNAATQGGGDTTVHTAADVTTINPAAPSPAPVTVNITINNFINDHNIVKRRHHHRHRYHHRQYHRHRHTSVSA
ncbi:MAG: hypothetical protein JO362_04150 [Streptomycetaceae bacterium]|nr:hypothetical protein [Streptomycetaceae bacterium]